MPRVKPDGTLVTVAVVNTTIGESAPTRFAIRGVPPHVEKAVWHPLDGRPVDCALVRKDGTAVVTIPSLGGWSAGWLDLRSAATAGK